MTEDARKKLGLFVEPYTLPARNTFRHKTGLPAYHGYLKFTRNSTNVIVGKVTEDNINTTIFHLSPFDLAKLKTLLKDFDARLYTWKAHVKMSEERKF